MFRSVYPHPARRPDNIPDVDRSIASFNEWRSSLPRTPEGYPWLEFPTYRQQRELGIPAIAQMDTDAANRYVLVEHYQSNPQEAFPYTAPGHGQHNVRVVAQYVDDIIIVDRVARPRGQPQDAS